VTTGMEGFAAGASALAGQAAGLRAAVDSGKVVMTPEAAEAVAKIYEDKARKIFSRRRNTEQLIVNGAYGDCFTGRQLEEKFLQKVQADEVGLIAILEKVEKILKDMAQAFRDSAREMTNADDEYARNINRTVWSDGGYAYDTSFSGSVLDPRRFPAGRVWWRIWKHDRPAHGGANEGLLGTGCIRRVQRAFGQ